MRGRGGVGTGMSSWHGRNVIGPAWEGENQARCKLNRGNTIGGSCYYWIFSSVGAVAVTPIWLVRVFVTLLKGCYCAQNRNCSLHAQWGNYQQCVGNILMTSNMKESTSHSSSVNVAALSWACVCGDAFAFHFFPSMSSWSALRRLRRLLCCHCASSSKWFVFLSRTVFVFLAVLTRTPQWEEEVFVSNVLWHTNKCSSN